MTKGQMSVSRVGGEWRQNAILVMTTNGVGNWTCSRHRFLIQVPPCKPVPLPLPLLAGLSRSPDAIGLAAPPVTMPISAMNQNNSIISSCRCTRWLAAVIGLLVLASLPQAAAQYDAPKATNALGRFPWPDGKRAALSITFDDARPSQVDAGLPLLDRYRVHATFYVSPRSVGARLAGWKQAVASGHEIGNHSLSHPCTANFEFIHTNALEDMTLDLMRNDLDLATQLIKSYLGVTPVSFAYPCGQTFVGRGTDTRSYVPVIAERFRSGRLWLSEDSNDPRRCDTAQLFGMELDGKSFSDLQPKLTDTLRRGRWLILAGHEIGGSGQQTSRTNTLEALCNFAADPTNGLWLGTVGEITTHVLRQRSKSMTVEESTR